MSAPGDEPDLSDVTWDDLDGAYLGAVAGASREIAAGTGIGLIGRGSVVVSGYTAETGRVIEMYGDHALVHFPAGVGRETYVPVNGLTLGDQSWEPEGGWE